MRLAFLGTPEAAVPTLDALIAARHEVVLVVTRVDKRRGRGSELSPSPVKVAALAHGLRVSHRLSDVEGSAAELGVVVAYGAIIPAPLLEVVPMLNVHFSLLPRWRGAAPVQRAILAGDEVTGVSIISLEAALDTGPVHVERRVPIEEKSAADLTHELALVGAAALVEVLASPALLANPVAQSGEATYAEKLTKETLHLEPSGSATLALRTVRLGGAFCFVDAVRLTVFSAHRSTTSIAEGSAVLIDGEVVLGTRDGAFALSAVRPEGSATMDPSAWWRGRRHGDRTTQWS
jgi:methionyl-tRNA formyltransferase